MIDTSSGRMAMLIARNLETGQEFRRRMSLEVCQWQCDYINKQGQAVAEVIEEDREN